MKSNSVLLNNVLDTIKPMLEQLSETETSIKPRPEKWSKKEILGHLIDSSYNNYQRFIHANFQDHLVFNGYQQDDWVALQNYQNRDWQSLIDLWYHSNLHIVHLVNNLPENVLFKIHEKHNLDKVTGKPLPENQAANLDYLISDYIVHLEYHMVVILPEYKKVAV